MQLAFKKDKGHVTWEDVEIFVLVRRVEDKKIAHAWEKAYIREYATMHPNGFNHWFACGHPGVTTKNWGGILRRRA